MKKFEKLRTRFEQLHPGCTIIFNKMLIGTGLYSVLVESPYGHPFSARESFSSKADLIAWMESGPLWFEQPA